MKKVLITMVIVLASLVGFSQAAPTQVYRIADATTPFGVNISVGKQVYNIATQELWIATDGVASTANLTTAAASFKIVNGAGTANLAEGTATETTVEITSSTGTAATLESASTLRAGLMSKAMFDQHLLNNAKITNKQSDLSLGTATATTLPISNSDGTGVILAAATTSEIGLMTAAQVIKLDAIPTGSSTEKFEVASEPAEDYTLQHTALTAGCQVSLNGTILDPSNYTLTANKLAIGLPVSQYDLVVITYNY